jgi:cellulase/cellobiase CelA1
MTEHVTVSGSYSVGFVTAGGDDVGGLVGLAEQDVTSSYWATDTSGLPLSAGNPQGALLSELQCPTGATNVDDCLSGVTLYDGWESYTDGGGAAYWNFGDATQLPGLCLGGTLYRVSSEDRTELLPLQSCDSIDNGDLVVDVDVYDEFAGGYCAYLTVTNTGPTAVNPWAVDFAIEGTFSGGWNANYSQAGNVLSATPVGWNNYLGPGQSTENIGFCATVAPTSGGGGKDGGILIEVEVVDEFEGGYCTVVTLTNTTGSAIDPWNVTFEVDGTVNDFWNTSWSQSGGEVTIQPVGWNSYIGAGQTLSGLGYCADL